MARTIKPSSGAGLDMFGLYEFDTLIRVANRGKLVFEGDNGINGPLPDNAQAMTKSRPKQSMDSDYYRKPNRIYHEETAFRSAIPWMSSCSALYRFSPTYSSDVPCIGVTWEISCNFSPSVAKLRLPLGQDAILVFCPLAAVDSWVQVVMTALLALFWCSCSKSSRNGIPVSCSMCLNIVSHDAIFFSTAESAEKGCLSLVRFRASR
jgi:hypothetical protein